MTEPLNEPIGDCHFTFKLGPSVEEPGITCKMRCTECGVKIQFDVIARRNNQDVVEWVEQVSAYAGTCHKRVSSSCANQVCDLQIPMPDGNARIGEILKS